MSETPHPAQPIVLPPEDMLNVIQDATTVKMLLKALVETVPDLLAKDIQDPDVAALGLAMALEEAPTVNLARLLGYALVALAEARWQGVPL